MVKNPLHVGKTIELAITTLASNFRTIFRVTWFSALLSILIPAIALLLGGFGILLALAWIPTTAVWSMALYRIIVCNQLPPEGMIYYYFGPLEKRCAGFLFSAVMTFVLFGFVFAIPMVLAEMMFDFKNRSELILAAILIALVSIPALVAAVRFYISCGISLVLIVLGEDFTFPRWWEINRKSAVILRGRYFSAFLILLVVAVVNEVVASIVDSLLDPSLFLLVMLAPVALFVSYAFGLLNLSIFAEIHKSCMADFEIASRSEEL